MLRRNFSDSISSIIKSIEPIHYAYSKQNKDLNKYFLTINLNVINFIRTLDQLSGTKTNFYHNDKKNKKSKTNRYMFDEDIKKTINRLERMNYNKYLPRTIYNKININNNTNNKILKILSPKSILRREEIKLVDEDKISNDDIFNQNLFFRVEKLKGFDNDNFSYGSSSNLEDNTKSNMINSASQTSNNNKCEEDKIKNEKKKLILRPQSHTIMQNNYLYHSLRSYNNSINRKDDINKPNRAFNTPKNYKFEKKLLFWDEENQKIKLFTPRSNKSQSINNIIKNI